MQKLRSDAWIEGPGRYREVEEAEKKDSVLAAPTNLFTVPSYDQQIETVNEY